MRSLKNCSLITIFFFVAIVAFSQNNKTENLVIVTLDGMRWQEVFGGMDSLIAVDSAFNQNDHFVARKELHRIADGHILGRTDINERAHEVAPGSHEGPDRHRGERGLDLRKHHRPEVSEVVAAIDLRGVFELGRDGQEELAKEKHVKG